MAVENKIGEAYVEVRATLDKLKKDLKMGEKSTKKSVSRMNRIFSKGASIVGGFTKKVALLGSALAIGLVAGAGKASSAMLDTLDSIDKLSSKLGVSTEFLQESAFAASQAGIEFNTMTMAMQRFTRRAAEAAIGTGEAKAAIEELGITLLDGAGNLRSSEDLFREALAALGQVVNAGTKLRLAFKLFDSEGAALVNVAGRFDELSRVARENGIIMDRSVIAQAVMAKDKLDLLWKMIRANASAALVDFSDVAIAAAEALATIAQHAGVAWARLKDLFNLRPTNIVQVKDRLGELKDEIIGLTGQATRSLANFRRVFEREFDPTSLKKADVLQRRFLNGIKEQIKLRAMERTELQGQLDDLNKLSEVPPPVTLDPVHLARVSDAVRKINSEIFDSFDAHAEQVEQLEGLWEDLSGSASRSFTQMLLDGDLTFKALGESFVRNFTQKVLEDLVLQKLINFGTQLLGLISRPTATTQFGPFQGGLVTPESNNGFLNDGSNFQSPFPESGGFSISGVTVINQSPSIVTTQSSLDGQIDIFIGQSAANSLSGGGALSGAMSDQFGLTSRPLRG